MEQFALFATPKPPTASHRLFLAIFPEVEAADLICGYQTDLRCQFGLTGKPRPRDILHVTLHHIDDYPRMPEREITAATKVCESILAHWPSFEVNFDSVMSFHGNDGNNPFVLVNNDSNNRLLELHRVLVTSLVINRLAKPKDLKFVPHVTMLYDRLIVPRQPVRSVKWTVKEVALVLSHLGLTKYERLGCWTLDA